MARSLPARPSLSSLHKQAKQLLKRFRAHDPDAQRKVRDLHPRAETFSSLRDAQLVVAREYGSPSWRVLTQRVELALLVNLPLAEQADRFVDLACVQYNGVDRVERYRRAQQLLAQTPDIADVNLTTAVVAGRLTLASDMLRANPGRVLNLLLQRGADINAANDNGETPLDTCLERDDDELAALLLASGARRGAAAGSSG